MSGYISDLPSRQPPVSSCRVYPTNAFIEFLKEDIEQSIPNRFEQQVNRYPNRIAIKTKTQEFTYEQLNKTANRLARALLSPRGKGEKPIALLLEKGAILIAAMLGVLKIGKIYVVLDPSFPSARNAYILADSQAKLIVTNNGNIALARELAQENGQLLNVDEIDSVFSTDNMELSISPDTLAHIIYTSGSTGQPKGVVQNHRNVLHNCMINTNAYHINSDDRMTLLHSCSVLGGTRGIFNALLNGATLYPLDVKSEGLTGLLNLLIEDEITVYHSVTTLFRYLANTLTGVEKFPKLRLI